MRNNYFRGLIMRFFTDYKFINNLLTTEYTEYSKRSQRKIPSPNTLCKISVFSVVK
jgi:hypothetical protein